MLKKHELTNPESCLYRAKPSEMLFVLLARDVCAADTIRDWVKRRIVAGKNIPGDAQTEEARACADEMDRQYRAGDQFADFPSSHRSGGVVRPRCGAGLRANEVAAILPPPGEIPLDTEGGNHD